MDSVLNRKVLVLNQGYEPLMVINAKRAIVLVIKEKVKMLEKYNESIRSVRASFDLPSVIRLNFYVHLRYKDIILNRRNILKRDNFTCQYCVRKLHSSELTIDHIVPKSRGGKSNWTNCVIACNKCNSKKGSNLISEIGFKLMRKPFKPKFNMLDVDVKIKSWEHFLGEAYWNVELK